MYPFPYSSVSSPSTIEGWARILDFGDTFTRYNYSTSEEVADTLALEEDWRAVGSDLFWALSQFHENHRAQLNGRVQQQDR